MLLFKTYLALGLLGGHPGYINQVSKEPVIISLKAGYPTDGSWIKIPKGTREITFKVQSENTETILFWLIPTGTQTWTERKLIGYDIKENENDNNFSFVWNIDQSYLHDHLSIQALGEGITSNIINLQMK